MIATICTLHGTAHEWTKQDDYMFVSALANRHTPPLTEEVLRSPTVTLEQRLRQVMEWKDPGMTDAEMVGHLTRNIDRLLAEAQTGNANRLLPYLTFLDNPNAAEQLEHYLNKVTYDEELWRKLWEAASDYMRQHKVPVSISVFQEAALKNLLPLLDDERRDILVKDVATNERYGVRAKRMVRERYAEIMAREAEAQDSPKNENLATVEIQNVQADAPPEIEIQTRKELENPTIENQEQRRSRAWLYVGIGILALIGGFFAWRKYGHKNLRKSV